MSKNIEITNDDHVWAEQNYKMTLIQYADYRCPYSAAAFPTICSTLKGYKNDIRFVYRQFPLVELHPGAFQMSLFAEAAGRQGLFWPAHKLLFESYRKLNSHSLSDFIERCGLNPEQFVEDLNSPSLREKIINDLDTGIQLGVVKTPSFILEGKLYQDEWHQSGFKNEIEQALKKLLVFTDARTTI